MQNISQKQKIVIGGIILVIVSFLGGMQYGKGNLPQGGMMNGQFSSRSSGNGTFGGRTRGMNANFVAGEILSKDAQSITVKLQNGGSSIVYVSPSTTVQKSVAGTQDDLVVGQNVLVTGTPNSSGSINAETVQLRPARTATSTGPVMMGY